MHQHMLICQQEALEEQNKARIEQAKKMDILIKRMDHMERARRENEAPLLQEAYAQKIKVPSSSIDGPACIASGN